MARAAQFNVRLALLGVVAAFAALAAPAADAPSEDGRQKQEIIFNEIPEHSAADSPFAVAVRATSGLPVSLALVSGPAVLDGRTLKLTGSPGLVILRASQDGNDLFQPARKAERAFNVRAVPAAPVVTRQPAGTDAAVGDRVVLSVTASGEPAPTYQWRRDGDAITGANERSFTIALAQPTDAGTYDVVVSNASGSVASQAARVTVGKRRQTITFQPPPGMLTAGQSVTLYATASSGLPVVFAITSGSGYMSGNTLTSTLSGTVLVQATQAGDTDFEEAEPVTQTLIFASNPGQGHP
jgi:hypothetical protein